MEPTLEKKDKLYEALAKAKLEYRNVTFNRVNSFNKEIRHYLFNYLRCISSASAGIDSFFSTRPVLFSRIATFGWNSPKWATPSRIESV